MRIYSINDKKFEKYGRVVDCPFAELFDVAAKALESPETGTKYLPSVESMESEEALRYYRAQFGDMEVQIGCCWGRNDKLNGLEWHKSPEINYAVEDMILLLGDQKKMKGDSFDTKRVEGFLVKKGEAVEIYQTTLHLAPCAKDNAEFHSIVILPKGTNTPLENPSEDEKLIMKNKWLIIHPDFQRGVEMGRKVGLIGKNISVR